MTSLQITFILRRPRVANFSDIIKIATTFIETTFKGGFPLGKMSGNFAAKFIWTCAFLFVYSLAGKIFLFKIVKMDLTDSRRKNSPQLFDQSKHKYISIFALSANTFQSDQIKGGC